jgi:hypothetical protein
VSNCRHARNAEGEIVILTFLIWAFEAVTALAISGAITGVALLIGLAVWLHPPGRSNEAKTEFAPIYAVDDAKKPTEG